MGEKTANHNVVAAHFFADSDTKSVVGSMLINGDGNKSYLPKRDLINLVLSAAAIEDPSEKRIEERDGEYCVVSETTGRSFGCYPTMGEAEDRLAEIERLKKAASGECVVCGKIDAEQFELDQVFADYHALVNMSYSELKEWSENECSKKASLTRGPITRNLRLLSKKKEDWTGADIRDANKTIAFISRMMRMPDGEDVSEECPYSKREISLKNWAFDPRKASKALKALENREVQIMFREDHSKTKKALEKYKEHFFLGLVLEPQIEEDGSPIIGHDGKPVKFDLQGEGYKRSTVRRTAYEWMAEYQLFDYQHHHILKSTDVVPVSSEITRHPEKFILPDGTVRHVVDGAWLLGGIVHNDALWNEVETAKINGLSMNGFAKKVPVRKSASKTPSVLCFYHNDPDGQLSAAILDKSIRPDTDIDFVPITYGNDFPWSELAGRSAVFMLDFSLQPFSDMEVLAEVLDGAGIDFVWIDHHKSVLEAYAESELKGKIRGVQKSEPGKAACFLTWKFLFGDKEIPTIVDYVSKWDTWVWKDNANIRPVILAIMSDQLRKAHIGTWRSALDKNEDFLVDTYKSDGLAIIRWIEHSDKERMQRAFPVEFEGLNAIAVNTDAIGSNQFDSAKGDYDAGIAFGLKPGFGWDVHMYALKEGIDVGSICKKHGGGGHEGSGGFQCMQLPFAI